MLGGSDLKVLLVAQTSKEFACNTGDQGSIPGSGRSPGEGNGYAIPWRREFHGQRSLVGYSPQHYKELDMTEQLSQYIIKVCTLLFRHNAIAYFTDHSAM